MKLAARSAGLEVRLRLKRRRSRVPWMYLLYHARVGAAATRAAATLVLEGVACEDPGRGGSRLRPDWSEPP
jgi:hypothetical protein